jgi:hypothetical protein
VAHTSATAAVELRPAAAASAGGFNKEPKMGELEVMMKPSLKLAVLWLTLAQSAWATILPATPASLACPNAQTCSVPVAIVAGNTVLVEITLKSTANFVQSIMDNTINGSTYRKLAAFDQGSAVHVELWGAQNAAAAAWVSVAASAFDNIVVTVGQYSGVVAFGGVATNGGVVSSTSPTVTLQTQEAGDCVVAGFADAGVVQLSPSVGTLRAQATGPTDAGALTDNCSASPAPVTNTVKSSAPNSFAAAAVELLSQTKTLVIPFGGSTLTIVPPCPQVTCSLSFWIQNPCSATLTSNCVTGFQVTHPDPATGATVVDATLPSEATTCTIQVSGKDANGNPTTQPAVKGVATLRPPQ